MLGADGLWSQVSPFARRGGAALLLDRDGVLVEEVHYLHRVQDITMIPGAVEVVARANQVGVPVIVVTNQAGIGRGYYDWPEFAAVQQAIDAHLGAHGAQIDAAYACPHHPEGLGQYRHSNHPGRKPNPGMLLRAAADLAIDLPASWLVGDNVTDILAARSAGLAGALHVATGYGVRDRDAASKLATQHFEVRAGASIVAALELPLLSAATQTMIASDPISPKRES